MSKIHVFDLIRERHHSVARLIAAGHSASEVARLTGANEAQVIRQITDPTFRDLVSRYRSIDTTPIPNATARFQTYAVAA